MSLLISSCEEIHAISRIKASTSYVYLMIPVWLDCHHCPYRRAWRPAWFILSGRCWTDSSYNKCKFSKYALANFIDHHTSPILFLARYLSFFSYYLRLSRIIFAASTFAGDSKFGSTSIEVTLMSTAYIVRIGFHFSESFSWGLSGSSTGGCRIEMQTSPLG